jgi:hypothetical protein
MVASPPLDYGDVPWPIPERYTLAHARYWARLQSAGSWWSSAERIAIAREVRAAWHCEHCKQCVQALSPFAVTGEHSTVTTLPDFAIDAIHRIVTDSSRLSRRWYQGLLDQGLGEGHYIELLGTVVAIVSIDSFATAMGVNERVLPDAGTGAPDHYRPATAGPDDAWVPMVHEDNRDTPEADLWVANATGNVVRALSLVPEEVRSLKDLSEAHYVAMADVRKPGYAGERELSRTQMELVAGRTSALNACFY